MSLRLDEPLSESEAILLFDIIVGVLSLILLIYLMATIIWPEKL